MEAEVKLKMYVFSQKDEESSEENFICVKPIHNGVLGNCLEVSVGGKSYTIAMSDFSSASCVINQVLLHSDNLVN